MACGAAPEQELEVDALSPAQASMHEAVLTLYFPREITGVGAAELAGRRAALSAGLARSPAVRGLLAALAPALDASTEGGNFVGAARDKQQLALLALQRASAPGVAPAAVQLRAVYLSAIYTDDLEFKMAAIAAPAVAVPDVAAYVRAHWSAGPYAKLRYDARAHRLNVVDAAGALRPFAPDVIVVGSGPAGAVLAHELRRGGKVVALVERGPLVVPGTMNTRDLSWLRESGGARSSEGGHVFLRHGQVVGGGAEVNVDLAFSPTNALIKSKLASWRAAGAVGNEWSDAAFAEADAWVRGKLGTRTPAMLEVNANNALLWDGARSLNLTPALYNLNTFAPGQSVSPVMDKRSPVTAFVLPALLDKKNPLYLLQDTEALELLSAAAVGAGEPAVSGVRLRHAAPPGAAGVLGDLHGAAVPAGETYALPGRSVVLAAGALSSPALLLKSRLGNARVGTGMVLHPSMPIFARFDKAIDAQKGTASTVYSPDAQGRYVFEAMSATPSYLAIAAPGGPARALEFMRGYRNVGGFGAMLVDESQSSNRVYLAPSGQVVAHYELSASDKARMRAALAQGVSALFAVGARDVTLPTVERIFAAAGDDTAPGTFVSGEGVAQAVARMSFVPGQTFLSSAHMQSTCKMHARESAGVVGTDHHVYGARGVYVVDASVFPTSVGANPMMSIYASAKIFADRVQRGAITLR